MKKQILILALVAAMVTAIASGCSSTKDASGGADSTKVDSASTTTPAPAATDTTKKKDTSKKM
jgi:ABC-type glycerol-3-phosphate transport system substrate-binding protein